MTQYITSEIDNTRYCRTNGQFARHLRLHNMSYKEYYETYITKTTPLCRCGEPKAFYTSSETYANSCGNKKCVGISVSNTKKNWTEEQRNLDSANKKRVASSRTPEKIKLISDKARETFKTRYGVDWGTQSDTQKDKIRSTKLQKYGNAFYNNSEKSAEANRNKTAIQQDIINQKRRDTNMDRFGVPCVFLKPDYIKKSRQSNSLGKQYTFPSGKISQLRGYENLAINELLKLYNEEDLIIHDLSEPYKLPIFDYVDTRRHHLKYYPDIYIPKENLIIEVKSQWWWDGNGLEKYKSRLTNNLKKRQAVLDAGYNYQVWVYPDQNNHRVLKYDKDF